MDDKLKKLPWGLKAESLAPSSMKTLPESKLRAFQMGRNPLKGKAPSKLKEEEKKKAEEAAAAEVYAEYIESFQNSAAVGKAFVRGSVVNPDQEINEAVAHKYQKSTSKLAELAEEFKKSKETTEVSSKSELKKKKEKEKKKSNLELFKEELEKSQKERDIRHKIKKGDVSGIPDSVLATLPSDFFNKSGQAHSSNRNNSSNRELHRADDDDDFNFRYGGPYDSTDPNTTNLYIGNINPKMTEEQLCKVFGKFGPLASVKIMWPRTDEEKARNRNCGFVAYMNRADGERALSELAGKDICDYEMKLGWGKCVPIPPQPLYVPPEMIEARKPPPPSGLPFNGQISSKYERDRRPFDGNLENTIVKVVIPMERSQLCIINRMVEFVAREGPMFEAMIMNRELHNPMFRFLFDNKNHGHIYYRWRLFSILQGDTPQKWSQAEFRMFKGGAIWRPPQMNPFSMSSLQSTSHGIASVSSAIAHSGIALQKQDKDIPVEVPKKDIMSDSQRDKLEDLLRTVTTDRKKVGQLMVWCLDHADFAEEIVEFITESLSLEETPMPTKIARLYVVSDILRNSAAKVQHASHFRQGFQKSLGEIMSQLRLALVNASSKAQVEKFRKQVLSCLAAWQDWSIYPPGFLINLQNVFVGLSDKKVSDLDGFPLKKEAEVDGLPLGKEDVDGVPLESTDLDGFPLVKDEDIDGIPLSRPTDRSKSRMKTSRWDPVETEEKVSRWEKVPEESDAKVPKSKWEQDDTEDESKSKWISEKTAKSKWQKVNDSPQNSPSQKDSTGEVDEGRRKLLREVEVKVMKFADKLEASGMSRTEKTVQDELERYRTHLIEEYERDRRKKKERKRGRSTSSSPGRTPAKGSPRRKRSHRSRSRSRSRSESDSPSEREGSRSSRKHSRSTRDRKSRSRSVSPNTPRRSSKKKKKKSRK